jgi:hypothetical protein
MLIDFSHQNSANMITALADCISNSSHQDATPHIEFRHYGLDLKAHLELNLGLPASLTSSIGILASFAIEQ